jgi:phosphoribosylamine--glycine ligase
VNIIPYGEFVSFDDAVDHVTQNPGRYVIKPSGEAQNVKRRLFVGEEDEGYVGYIDVNCIVNNHGIYPLEFSSRFGYPTISIQQAGMLTPIGQFFLDLADGNDPKLKTRSGFQIGVRIVVPPFPFDDDETFDSFSKDSVIVFKKPPQDEIHIEDVKQVNGQWLVAGTQE